MKSLAKSINKNINQTKQSKPKTSQRHFTANKKNQKQPVIQKKKSQKLIDFNNKGINTMNKNKSMNQGLAQKDSYARQYQIKQQQPHSVHYQGISNQSLQNHSLTSCQQATSQKMNSYQGSKKVIQIQHTNTNTMGQKDRETIKLMNQQRIGNTNQSVNLKGRRGAYDGKLNDQNKDIEIALNKKKLAQLQIEFQKVKQWKFIQIYSFILNKIKTEKLQKGIMSIFTNFPNLQNFSLFGSNQLKKQQDIERTSKQKQDVEKQCRQLQKQFDEYYKANIKHLQKQHPRHAQKQYDLISVSQYKKIKEDLRKLQQSYSAISHKKDQYKSSYNQILHILKLAKQQNLKLNKSIENDKSELHSKENEINYLKVKIFLDKTKNIPKGNQSLKYSQAQLQQLLREKQYQVQSKFEQAIRHKLNQTDPHKLFQIKRETQLNYHQLHKPSSQHYYLKVYILDGETLDQIIRNNTDKKINHYQNILQSQKLQIDKIQSENKLILSNLEKTQNQLQKTQEELRLCKNQSTKLESYIKKAQDLFKYQIKNLKEKYDNELNKQRNQHDNKLNKQRDQKLQLQQTFKLLQSENQLHHQQINQHQIRQSIKRQYEQDLKQFQKINKKLGQQLLNCKEALQQKQGMEIILAQSFETQIKGLNKAIQDLNQQIIRIKQQKYNNQQVAAANYNIATSNILSQVNQEHKKQIQAKQQVICELKIQYEKDLNEYQVKIYKLGQQNSTLEDQIHRRNSSNSERTQNQEILKFYGERILQLEQAIMAHDRVKQAYEGKIKKYEKQNADLLKSVEIQGNQKKEFDKKVTELTDKIRDIERRQNQENQDVEAHIRHLEDENRLFKDKLTHAIKEKDAMSHQLSKEKKTADKMKKKTQEKDQQLAHKETEIQQKHKTITDIKKQLQQKFRLIQGMQNLNSNWQSQVNQVTSVQKQNQRLLKNNKHLQNQLIHLKDLTSRLKDHQKKQNELSEELRAKQTRIGQLENLLYKSESSNNDQTAIIKGISEISNEIEESFRKLKMTNWPHLQYPHKECSQPAIESLIMAAKTNLKSLVNQVAQTHLQLESQLQQQKQKTYTLEIQYNQTVKQLHIQTAQVNSLNSKILFIEQQLNQHQDTRINQQDSHCELLQLKQSLIAKDKQLKNYQQELKIAAKKLNTFEQQLNQANSQIYQLKRQSQTIVHSYQSKTQSLKNQNQQLNHKIQQLQSVQTTSNKHQNLKELSINQQLQHPQTLIQNMSQAVNFAAQILIKKLHSVHFLNSLIQKHTQASIDSSQIIYKRSLQTKDLNKKMHQIFNQKTPLRAFLLLCKSKMGNQCAIFCFKNGKDETLTLLINLNTMKAYGPKEGTKARAYAEKNGISTVNFGEGEVRIQSSDSLVLQMDFQMTGERYFEIQNERDFTNESSNEGNLRMEEMELYQVIFRENQQGRFNI